MNLKILSSRAVSLSLEQITAEISQDAQKKMQLIFSNQYEKNNNKIFNVVFELFLLHPNDFSLKTKFVTWFETDTPIDDTFINSDFPKINAPAIAFPFLRSFVSTITLNAGYAPVLLPSINFVNFNNS